MQLNLPEIEFKSRKTAEGKVEIFDVFRKRYVVLTPEEWVRQHFLHFLVNQKEYPSGLISVEKGLLINNLQKRFDAVIFDRNGSPKVLIEFKSPKVKLTQKTFDQVSVYNLKMQVKYLIVSNGLEHFCCKMDYENHNFTFLREIPSFFDLALD